jgi:hypothetical protein
MWAYQKDHPLREILPHATLLILAAEILCFSFHLMFNELVEPIAAMYVMLFAWQICQPYWSGQAVDAPANADVSPT